MRRLGRTVVWLALVAVLVIWLSEQSRVPGWLLTMAVAAAVPLGLRASVKQKRLERAFMRASWRRLWKQA